MEDHLAAFLWVPLACQRDREPPGLRHAPLYEDFCCWLLAPETLPHPPGPAMHRQVTQLPLVIGAKGTAVPFSVCVSSIESSCNLS